MNYVRFYHAGVARAPRPGDCGPFGPAYDAVYGRDCRSRCASRSGAKIDWFNQNLPVRRARRVASGRASAGTRRHLLVSCPKRANDRARLVLASLLNEVGCRCARSGRTVRARSCTATVADRGEADRGDAQLCSVERALPPWPEGCRREMRGLEGEMR